MDWIHCNKCYYTKTSSNEIQFYCGSCSHIICKNCLQSKCPVCQNKFNYTELNDKIQPDATNVVRTYFEDLNVSRLNLQKRAKFQYEQRTRLENQRIKIFDVIKKDKNDVIELRKIETLAKNEIRENLRKIKQYKNYIKTVRNASSLSAKSSSRNSHDSLRNSMNSFNYAATDINGLERQKNDLDSLGYSF